MSTPAADLTEDLRVYRRRFAGILKDPLNISDRQDRLTVERQNLIADFESGSFGRRTGGKAQDFRFFFRIEREADCVRHRVGIKHAVGNWL